MHAGDVSITITNPKNVDVHYEIEENEADETIEVRYTPKVPGNYCISVTFNNEEVPQSPIKIFIEPDIDVTKIRCTGINPSKFALLLICCYVSSADSGEWKSV